MTAGAQIAAEARAGIIEAVQQTGDGKRSTIQRKTTGPTTPWDGTAQATENLPVWAMQGQRIDRDGSGGVLRTTRVLTIAAGDAVPVKSDRIAVGVEPGDVVEATRFDSVTAVKPYAPGGVALYYECDLEG